MIQNLNQSLPSILWWILFGGLLIFIYQEGEEGEIKGQWDALLLFICDVPIHNWPNCMKMFSCFSRLLFANWCLILCHMSPFCNSSRRTTWSLWFTLLILFASRKAMLRVDAKQGAPKDGNSPLELFQVIDAFCTSQLLTWGAKQDVSWM